MENGVFPNDSDRCLTFLCQVMYDVWNESFDNRGRLVFLLSMCPHVANVEYG